MKILVNIIIVLNLALGVACAFRSENTDTSSKVSNESAQEDANRARKEKSRQQYDEILARLKGDVKSAESSKRDREYHVRRTLVRAFVRWAQNRESSAADELDAQLASVSQADDVGAAPFFYSAQMAHLRGNTQQALSLLRTAIQKYPDATAPNTVLPVHIQAGLWIAMMQRQIGDTASAIETYETVKKQLDLEKRDQRMVLAICCLNIAEIASEPNGDSDLFLRATDGVLAINKTSDTNLADCLDFYQKWAQYARTMKTAGKSAALNGMVAPQNLSPLIPVGYANVNGMLPYNLLELEEQTLIGRMLFDRINVMPAAGFEKGIMRLISGYPFSGSKDYVQSEAYLTSVLEDGTFFSPLAGVYLAESKKKRGLQSDAETLLDTVRTKYPGYTNVVTKMKKDWSK